MELDRDVLEKVMGLSDNDLTNAMTRIARGLGLDEALLKPYLARTDQIREALAHLTPEDLDRVVATLGEERTREVLEKIRSEVNPA